MKRVFVSYSRNNLEAVTQLVEDLQAVDIDVWHDQTLAGGQRWWDDILANIRQCDIFIFSLSPESWDSEACKSELGYVVQLGKPILPVLVADGININLLSHPLNEIQVIDYRRRDRAATLALFKAINTAPAAPPLPEPLPKLPPVPVSYLSTLKERIDAAEPLSSQAQITLIFELEEELRDGRSPAEIRDLLLRLRRRDELLAKIATKIDAALKSLEEKPAAAKPVGIMSAPPTGNQVSTYQPPAAPEQRFCQQCRARLEPGGKFCAGCGTKVVPDGGPHAPAVENSVSRRYICQPSDTPQLIADVKGWLGSQDFDTQQVNAENEGLLLQIKKRGSWRDYVGMSTSLNILFRQTGETLVVEIGAGKWIDKAAVGTVSMFILWPLAITAGYGAWEQMKMPDRIFDFIGSRLVYR